jgi:hypothetical protein
MLIASSLRGPAITARCCVSLSSQVSYRAHTLCHVTTHKAVRDNLGWVDYLHPALRQGPMTTVRGLQPASREPLQSTPTTPSHGRRRTMVPELAPTVTARLGSTIREAVPVTFQADIIVTDNYAS